MRGYGRAGRCLPCLLTGHHVLYQADHDGHDCARDAAANGLSESCADIDIARRSGEHGQERSENLPAARATECAGDGVAERTEVKVLESGADSVSADCAGDKRIIRLMIVADMTLLPSFALQSFSL